MSSSSAPPILTPLVGRGAELRRVTELLEGGARVVTIVGPPGIGKTRLALAVRAARMGGWVDLSTARASTEVCARIAAGLDLRPSWIEPYDLVEELGWAIDGLGEVSLFLDDAEGCVATLAEVLARALSVAPRARAIVTSRERLGLPGEAVVELGPLGLPHDDEGGELADAERLLLSRAGLEAPRDARERAAIAALVRALEGVPLAIELAAARLALLGVEELLERMPAPLDVLDARPPRGRSTLRAALEASHRLLTDEERRALACCSVFAGSFSTEAAEAVVGEGAIALLAALRDKSLLARDEGGLRSRHRLYATVRAFAAERLVELGLAADVRARHEKCFVAFADAELGRLDGRDGPRARRALAAELDELRLALTHAESFAPRASLVLAISAVLVTRGPPTEALDAISPLLVGAPKGPTLVSLHARRGEALQALGRIEEALEASRAALEGATSDRATQSSLLSAIARAELARGRLEDASRAAADAVRFAPSRSAAKVDALRARGVVSHARGILEQAVEDYEDACALADELGLVHRAACASADIATVRLQERRLDEARERFERAIERIHPEVDPTALGLAEGNLAILEQELGHHERAEALYARGIDRLRRSGHRLYTAHLLGYAGSLEHERGRIPEAIARYEEALAVLRRVGDARLLVVIAGLCGAAEAARGRLDAGRERLLEARGALDQVDDPGVLFAHRVHRAFVALADARGGAGSIDAAHAEASRAIAEAERTGALAASDDVRIACRILAAATGRGALGVDNEACVVVLPDGERVELASRAVLWRLVAALVAARRARPGEGLDTDALLDAGWPDEQMGGESGQNRLKVALSTLRKLGLRDLLVRTDGGYCLDPRVPLDERPATRALLAPR